MISINYSGDDFGVPVYAIAIVKGCPTDRPWRPDCLKTRTARMVRAPAPPDITRPRQRGYLLLERIAKEGASTRVDLSARLDRAKLEWMEADIGQCPAAGDVLGQSGQLTWVPSQFYTTDPATPPDIVLHADTVEIRFSSSLKSTSYKGIIEGQPAEWGVALAALLEPCWRAATVPVPWRR